VSDYQTFWFIKQYQHWLKFLQVYLCYCYYTWGCTTNKDSIPFGYLQLLVQTHQGPLLSNHEYYKLPLPSSSLFTHPGIYESHRNSSVSSIKCEEHRNKSENHYAYCMLSIPKLPHVGLSSLTDFKEFYCTLTKYFQYMKVNALISIQSLWYQDHLHWGIPVLSCTKQWIQKSNGLVNI